MWKGKRLPNDQLMEPWGIGFSAFIASASLLDKKEISWMAGSLPILFSRCEHFQGQKKIFVSAQELEESCWIQSMTSVRYTSDNIIQSAVCYIFPNMFQNILRSLFADDMGGPYNSLTNLLVISTASAN